MGGWGDNGVALLSVYGLKEGMLASIRIERGLGG